MKDDEKKKALSWEAADPKPPVIQSGHMENRAVNSGAPGDVNALAFVVKGNA